jgi:ribokinase
MRIAVVGHVEWIRFCRVERIPGPGGIAHGGEAWEQAGGAGAVAAVQLALLGAECHLLTCLGNDELGRRSAEELRARGVHVHVATDERPTRWAFTQVDDVGERTITTVGAKLHPRGHDDRLPWPDLREMGGVFVTAGDVDAVRAARRSPVLVATARELATLRRAGVELDALVGSAADEAERYTAGELDPAPRLVVATSGALGGWMQPGGPYTAAPLPGPVVDSYGAGDSFMAGLTYGLASGLEPSAAVALASRCGAAAITGRGVAPQKVDW